MARRVCFDGAMRRPAALLGIVTLMVLWTLSACGADDAKKPVAEAPTGYAAKSVTQIELDAVAAMSKIDSLHMKGRLTVADEGTFTFDVSLTRSGDCSGHFDLKELGRAYLLQVDGTPYLRWSKELWGHVGGGSGITAEAIAGRWVDASAKGDLLAPCAISTSLSRASR